MGPKPRGGPNVQVKRRPAEERRIFTWWSELPFGHIIYIVSIKMGVFCQIHLETGAHSSHWTVLNILSSYPPMERLPLSGSLTA